MAEKREKRRIFTYANVMSSIAVVVAIGGGTAYAATQISGAQIENHTIAGQKLVNNTLSGKQINEGSLATVPSAKHAGTADQATTATTATTANQATTAGTANSLAPLASGASESGNFSGADGGAPSGGWLGVGITYRQPLAEPIANANIIDVTGSGPVTHCPGPGQADPGYLCLYNEIKSGVTPNAGYGYSAENYFTTPSNGVTLYFPVNGSDAYVGGEYTVTAP